MRNTRDRFCHWSRGHSWSLPSSAAYSVFPLPSVIASAGPGSFPGGMMQTFVPEGPGPLPVLPGLDCCVFPLTLTSGTVILRDALSDLLCPRHLVLGSLWSIGQFPLSIQGHSPQPAPELPVPVGTEAGARTSAQRDHCN